MGTAEISQVNLSHKLPSQNPEEHDFIRFVGLKKGGTCKNRGCYQDLNMAELEFKFEERKKNEKNEECLRLKSSSLPE